MWRLGLKEEGPGFVRGMQTRDRWGEIEQGSEEIPFFLRLNCWPGYPAAKPP
jgi:hypothetical protein